MVYISDDLAVSPRLYRTLERIAGYLGDDVQGMLEDAFSALVRMARDERSRDDDAAERAAWFVSLPEDEKMKLLTQGK